MEKKVSHSLTAIKLIIIYVYHKKFAKCLHRPSRWYIIIMFYTMLNYSPRVPISYNYYVNAPTIIIYKL